MKIIALKQVYPVPLRVVILHVVNDNNLSGSSVTLKKKLHYFPEYKHTRKRTAGNEAQDNVCYFRDNALEAQLKRPS